MLLNHVFSFISWYSTRWQLGCVVRLDELLAGL